MRIFVTEEYGYRHWLWEYPGTATELVADWQAGRAPLNFFNPSQGEYRGSMTEVFSDVEAMPGESVEEFRAAIIQEQVAWEKLKVECDATAHVHTPDDTWLRVNGERYPHPEFCGCAPDEECDQCAPEEA